jgi:predicted DNA-binding transcriptional regulator YafY
MSGNQSSRNYAGTQAQLNRLYGLVQRIERGDYPTQKVLAEEWEKTPRTIQTDLDFMRDVWRLPLEYHEKRYGYYFSKPVGKFPMIQISEAELVSVFVAQKALSLYRGTPFEQPLRSAFQKLVSGLKGEISVAWSDLDAAISFRGIETKVGDVGILNKLGDAVRKRKEVEFEYFKLGNDAGMNSRPGSHEIPPSRQRETARSPALSSTTGGGVPQRGEMRRVRPYHLACVGGQWYLFAYDPMRGAIRKFVPARMRRLRLLAKGFMRPKDFSVEKFLKGSFGVFSGEEPRRVRVWVDRARAQIVRERTWHHSQRVKELKDGDIEVSFEVSSYVEIVQWILSWGEYARAVAPTDLADEVAAVAGRIVRRYKRD